MYYNGASMANNIYSSQILPGTPPPKEKQRHLAVLFIIIAIVIILSAVTYRYTVPNFVSPAKPESPVVTALRNAPEPSAEQTSAIIYQLKNTSTNIPAAQQQNIINQLNNL